jgi:hypothetical protein
MRTFPSLLLTLAILALGACGGRSMDAQLPEVIPAGRANWITLEEDQQVDELMPRELSFAYRITGHGPAVTDATSVTQRATLIGRPTPLQPADRCGLELLRLRLQSAAGTSTEIPVAGYITDNSDGARGFRLELAKQGERKLVIPAGATATVVFTQDVVLPK